MDADRTMIAQQCIDAAHDGSLSFPEIIGTLMNAGFEGYAVDYRRDCQSFHLPDRDPIDLAMPRSAGAIAPAFDARQIAELVRWAQRNDADYSYAAFCEKAKAAGCAGYLVSFTGRRVVYYGRTAETHVELFPQ